MVNHYCSRHLLSTVGCGNRSSYNYNIDNFTLCITIGHTMQQNEIKTIKYNIVIFFYYMDIHYYNDFTKQNKK